jgi:hypothetical protein
MTSVAAKLWFAVAGLAGAAFIAYEFASSGEWFGSFILATLVVVAGLLGVMAVLVRDGDVDAVDTTVAEVPVRSALPAAWPALVAVGGGVAIVGLAASNALLYVGIGIVALVGAEWMVQGWAERASTDHEFNRALRKRIMSPFEIPALALIVIAIFLGSLSRVLLALPKTGSTITAIAVASTILLIASLLAARPRIGSSVLAGVLAFGAVALIAAGIVGGVHGERNDTERGAHQSTTETTTGAPTSTSTTAATP